MSEAPLVRCPNCNTDNLVRVLGGGAGLIFKGSGFYLTDYKKDNKKSETPSGKKQDKPSEKKETTSPAPSDSKSTDSKPSSEAKPKKE